MFLAVTYSADAKPALPRHLVVKSSAPPSRALHRSTSEIEFYRSVARRLASPPLVRCLAEDSEDILVLDDLRMTHHALSWPLAPSRAQALRAVDALAQIHAAWWEAPALGHGVGELHTTESLTNMVHGFAANVPAFFDALGDAATPAARQIVERVFASPLRPWLRLTQPRALTVAHGDAHAGNLFFPRAGDGPAYLIDWQLWHLDVGVRDLAFFIGLH
ncbi:MAG: phosphotransferase family protein, partial [Gemmatimonadaceae bacterium]